MSGYKLEGKSKLDVMPRVPRSDLQLNFLLTLTGFVGSHPEFKAREKRRAIFITLIAEAL